MLNITLEREEVVALLNLRNMYVDNAVTYYREDAAYVLLDDIVRLWNANNPQNPV